MPVTITNKGLVYELVLGMGTVFFLAIFFFLLAWPISDTQEIFSNMTTNESFGETLNETAIEEKYETGFNLFYFSLFFVVLIIFVWILKTAQKHSSRGEYD